MFLMGKGINSLVRYLDIMYTENVTELGTNQFISITIMVLTFCYSSIYFKTSE